MNVVNRTITEILRRVVIRLVHIDLMLLAIVVMLTTIGFVTLFSAGYSFPWRIEGQIRNIIIATVVMFIVATVPVKWFEKSALPLFVLGCLLLAATHVAGVTVKGATRWLDVGIRIQPSEIMKLALPMTLAWYYHRRSETPGWLDHFAAFVMLSIPIAFILKQPDLGTSILVGIAGFAVIYFAGLHWKAIAGLILGILAMLPIVWTMLHDYQRERVLTLLDPTHDPLGKGFHTIQALIAIGSGGLTGKGWMEGTQAHLDFIPERTSDFLFAVYGEEFGFMGSSLLLVLFTALVARSFHIASQAPTTFSRLLGGALGTIFFTYSFVNMGMVSGVLPVVGVPLPFMSYGGTALLILGVSTGILLSISAESKVSSGSGSD